jgi:mitochondrial pyruvate carrier 1
MRFSIKVSPMNPLLFSCHFTNEFAQLTQGFRYVKWRMIGSSSNELETTNTTAPVAAAAK